jgi:hypothetical protein
MAYRKLPGRLNQWHNNPSCPDWPMADYVLTDMVPADQDLCETCIRLDAEETESGDESR